MRIVLDVFGDVQLDRTLLRFADRTDDMRPVLLAIAEDFYKIEKSQFRSQGRFSGGWAPLSPDYAARKARRYPGAKILEATGDLRDSLTRNGARNHVRAITRDALVIGTRDPKAAYHQLGTPTMPRRRPVELSEGHRRAWVKGIQRFYTTGEAVVGGSRTRRTTPRPTT